MSTNGTNRVELYLNHFKQILINKYFIKNELELKWKDISSVTKFYDYVG